MKLKEIKLNKIRFEQTINLVAAQDLVFKLDQVAN